MKYTVAFIVAILTFFYSAAQDFPTTFQKYNGAFVPERMHFHFDKTSYMAGDTIWFKAYLKEGILPADRSKTLYIDWTDKEGNLVDRTHLPIVNGVTYGQIRIPETYSDHFIRVNAYTKWMLNFESDFLYNGELKVMPSEARKSTPEPLRYQFHLFPEGGNLVEGVNQKIAFKATDQYGRPIAFTGSLTANGANAQKIEPRHDGMGYFYLVPDKSIRYAVNWKDPSGKSHSVTLPEIERKGVALQIKDADDSKLFYVVNTDPAIEKVHLIGTMHQQAVFNIEKEFTDNKAQGIIPTTSLPSGILTITVLDNNYLPIAERITFINNGEYGFETQMEVQHWGLNKRARNEIEISIPENTFAHLSVSVTDYFIDYDTSRSIASDLLLSSELKGKINNPAFYFSHDIDSTRDLLDLVMLTHGWRKIHWADLAAGKLPEIKFPADTLFQTVSGKLYGALPSQLVNAGDIVLIVNQRNNNEWLTAPIKPDGSFNVGNFMLFDTATVFYQPPKNNQLKNVSVQFMQDRLPPQAAKNDSAPEYVSTDTTGSSRHFQLSQAMLDELKFFEGKVLEDVVITARTKSKEELLDEKYASGMFSGGIGRSFDLRDDPSAMASQNIFQYLQGRVAGVTVSMSDPPQVTWRGGSPALFLNEMPVDAEMLSSIPVTDIAYVKVLNPPFMGAANGANGAIAIYTRRGDDVQYEPGKGLSKNTITGYSMIRQFYSPDYDRFRDDKKDLRTTLYWNPEVVLTPDNNKALLKFFNNDVTDAFRVVIEGMTSDGKVTRLIQVME